MKSFLTRLGSGILLVAIILVTGAYGSWPLWIAVTLAGFVGLHEFYRAVDIQKNDLLWWIGMIGTGMWAFIEWIVCGGDLAWKENLWMTLVITLMLFLAVYVFSFPKYDTRKITEAYFGILYVPVMLSFIYQTRMLEDGFQLVWLIFLSAWGCDTCAYCTGVLIGKHKLAPVLSPKKSIEGAVGGVVGAALLGALFGALAEEISARKSDLAAQQAVQTVEAVTQGLARRRGDEFGHGLGLAQVHAAVDEGPARELAPLRGPCPQTQGRLQDGLHDEGAAVAMDLGHVFPGESARTGHEHGQYIIQRRAFMVQGAPAVQHPGPEARELCRRGAEHAGKDLPGLRPGDADDADAPRTGSRGYGGDGRHQERSGRRRMMTTRFMGPSPELRVCTSSASCRQRCTMRR